MTDTMIEAIGLRKRYGTTQALDGLDLDARMGTILGVLGPNGAGKTTAARVLTTLTVPDAGQARVAGHDVVADPDAVRRAIGVTAQAATVDEVLTGRQNLQMIGRLGDLSRREARARATELLERFGLTDAGDRMLRGYSGGMRRRLDLAAGLVTRPPVLFLDEPTTGLDPTSRAQMWDVIRDLVADGATLLLTTQYLEEADELADQIAVVDHGRVIAYGTAAQLKAQTGGATLEVTLSAVEDSDLHGGNVRMEDAVAALAPLVSGEILRRGDGRSLRAPVDPRPGLATTAVRALDLAGIQVDDVEVHQPSLDDVFFALTGDAQADAAEPAEAPVEVAA